jgi:sensor domain CHASE-containing protein
MNSEFRALQNTLKKLESENQITKQKFTELQKELFERSHELQTLKQQSTYTQ